MVMKIPPCSDKTADLGPSGTAYAEDASQQIRNTFLGLSSAGAAVSSVVT
ncbi:Uncharacterised protein [Mycobacteroides abscessus subsp. abscessus]|nr:Uncharacterised protein [Mycobacteroides abscessus subsp. abscessus]